MKLVDFGMAWLISVDWECGICGGTLNLQSTLPAEAFVDLHRLSDETNHLQQELARVRADSRLKFVIVPAASEVANAKHGGHRKSRSKGGEGRNTDE